MKACPQCGKIYEDVAAVCSDDNFKLVVLTTAGTDPFVGRLLDGRYRLLLKIGEGGMGCIYRSVHTEMGRACAIKLLTAVSPGKEDALARFKREAKMASRIDNAHAVTIYDFGAAEDGTMFLAMEFIDGRPLSKVIAAERPIAVERVVRITNQIAEGLAAAHAMGIVHRDLKPDNIMITRKGGDSDFVKVLDFGIAKTVSDERGDHLTKTGFVLGTPVYMSPEQLLGERLDPRSDIYSLAIIVYEMLSGRLPFEGENPQAVMMKRILSDPIRLRQVAPQVGDSIERVVMEGLERNRDQRTPTVESFAAALQSAVLGQTQVMGGRVTGLLSDAVTEQWSVAQTQLNRAGNEYPVAPRTAGPQTPPVEPPATKASVGTDQNGSSSPAAYASAPTPVPSNHRPDIRVPAGHEVTGKPPTGGKKWLLISGAFILTIVFAIVVVYLLLATKSGGFTLALRGLPAGASVLINQNPRGTVQSDGTLTLAGLEAGPIKLAVKKDGYADFVSDISGKGGETNYVEARMLPLVINVNGEMVLVDAGDFEMGDDSHDADEKPAHKVTLPAFYIDRYEVTNGQYRKFCDSTGTKPPQTPWEPNYFRDKPDGPVLGVQFKDAVAYASWAGKRLPTEEEWEKAACWDPVTQRKRVYPWGDDSPEKRANIGTQKIMDVDTYRGDVSPYGVYGMAGNANEWVDATYKGYAGNKIARPEANNEEYAVIRGGSCFSDPAALREQARATRRNYLQRSFPENKVTPIGFRCAASADDAMQAQAK